MEKLSDLQHAHCHVLRLLQPPCRPGYAKSWTTPLIPTSHNCRAIRGNLNLMPLFRRKISGAFRKLQRTNIRNQSGHRACGSSHTGTRWASLTKMQEHSEQATLQRKKTTGSEKPAETKIYYIRKPTRYPCFNILMLRYSQNG